jgi:hypothetical protein
MNAQDICDALRRYLSESADDRRDIAAKIGISWITLSAWRSGATQKHFGTGGWFSFRTLTPERLFGSLSQVPEINVRTMI